MGLDIHRSSQLSESTSVVLHSECLFKPSLTCLMCLKSSVVVLWSWAGSSLLPFEGARLINFMPTIFGVGDFSLMIGYATTENDQSRKDQHHHHQDCTEERVDLDVSVWFRSPNLSQGIIRTN